MRDRETELHYYPKDMLSLSGISRVLCIAPHPDDEVFGCAGALTLLARQGAQVQSIVVTQGDKALGESSADHAAQRMDESRRAAHILGCQPPQFLGFEDRTLSYSPALVMALGGALQSHFKPDSLGLLLLPSLSEPHPDHQAVALAGLSAALAWAGPLRVLFYEVGAPLHPNTYLDITAVADTKWQAVAQFDSQLGLESYEPHARAFASLRAFGMGVACEAAEAFFEVDLNSVKRSGPLAALPQWPWVRSRLQLANGPQDLPLVSVLIRSMDRPSLPETLASVAQQTYSHIEVLVVNATGRAHSDLSYLPGHLQARLIDPESRAALGRSEAANLALDQACGSHALFLDDDDLIAPEHLQRLVQAIHDQPRAVGAYSGVQVVGSDGQAIREYDTPWSPERLAGINFLPIHAVLFSLQAVRERHIRFDVNLPVLEDWDFWHQLSQGGELVHCPGVTAVYRQGLGQSGVSDPAHANHWKAWHQQLLERYLSQESAQDTARLLAWHAVELDKLGAQFDQLRHHEKAAQQQLAQSLADAQLQQQQARQHQQARDELQQQLERFSLQMQVELSAQEAKLQAYAAQTNVALSDKELQLQAQAHQHLQTLAEKEAELQRFAVQSQSALNGKEEELQRFAAQSQKALTDKETQLQLFAEQSQQALADKEALFQNAMAEKNVLLERQAAQFQQDLAYKEYQFQRELLQRQQLQETLAAVQSSRWWRWGQVIRRILGRKQA